MTYSSRYRQGRAHRLLNISRETRFNAFMMDSLTMHIYRDGLLEVPSRTTLGFGHAIVRFKEHLIGPREMYLAGACVIYPLAGYNLE